MDDLNWLVNWFGSQCDGNWEESHGIRIETLDNPGWRIKIAIDETELEGQQFDRMEIERSEDDWLHAWIIDAQFNVACGVWNLQEVLQLFRKWASSQFEGKDVMSKEKEGAFMEELNWLINWFGSQCDGDWEKSCGIKVATLDNPGWYMSIGIENTQLEGKEFESVEIERSREDWVYCFIREGCFDIACGMGNLSEALQMFRDWAGDEWGKTTILSKEKEGFFIEEFNWLASWFDAECDGDWEHTHGIEMGALSNPGWFLSINMSETELENKEFKNIEIERSEEDWMYCLTGDGCFIIACGLRNLPEGLRIFREWASREDWKEAIVTEEIVKDKTFQPQAIPKRLGAASRYDGTEIQPCSHFNKVTHQYVNTPHIHDPQTPGGIREPLEWEIPK